MNWEILIDVLRFISIGILLFIPIVLLKLKNWNQQTILSILLCLSTVSYLIVDWDFIQGSQVCFFFLAGAFAIPVAFWLFSCALFYDEFNFNWQHILILVGVVLVKYFLYYFRTSSWIIENDSLLLIGGLISETISLLFVVLAVFTAYKNQEDDLIEGRLHFRKQFILLTTILIGITSLVEISLRQNDAPEFLDFVQKFSITVLIYYFALQNLEFKSTFFLSKLDEEKNKPKVNMEKLEELKKLLNKEKIYRREGLTIRKLAEELDEKEYKVRQLINQHLGFRNFNDFLNKHRIQEACEILLDESQSDLTIIEIAFYLGYKSLGPFNSAFKGQTNLTPTEYRKKNSKK